MPSLRRSALVGTVALACAALIAPAGATPETFPQVPLVLDVRTSCNATYDRVVIDIAGPLPGYSATWIPKLIFDGSGAPVPLAGAAFVQVAMSNAAAHVVDGVDAGFNVYSGPKLATTPCTRLKGVALTGDFEGVVGVGLATNKKTSLHVFTLGSPSRLVIDVNH